DQHAARLELGLTLIEQRLRLRNLRFARLVGQNRDDVTFLHALSAMHVQLGEHAAGAGGDRDFVVGFGAAGERERRAVRHDIHRAHGDAEQRLGLLPGRANGGLTFRAVARQEMTGCDPERSGGNETDGSNTTGFHHALSPVLELHSPGLASRQRTIFRTIGSTRSASKPVSTARRHDMPSDRTMSTIAAASMSTSARISSRSTAARSIATKRALMSRSISS